MKNILKKMFTVVLVTHEHTRARRMALLLAAVVGATPRIVPALLLAALGGYALPALAEEPSVQLGVVAQRYPWNGTLDVGYKASGLPADGTNAVVTVAASGKTYTQAATLANGTNTVAFVNLPKDVKAKDAKVTLKLK